MGMALNGTDKTQCVPCSVGSYKENTGPQQCTLCKDNLTTYAEGESSDTACIGEYLFMCQVLKNQFKVYISLMQCVSFMDNI